MRRGRKDDGFTVVLRRVPNCAERTGKRACFCRCNAAEGEKDLRGVIDEVWDGMRKRQKAVKIGNSSYTWVKVVLTEE